jgi:hypothetical protein
MTTIGTVTGQEIKTNRDGGVDVRLLQIRMSSDTDIQTVQYFPMSGDDSPPIKGDKVSIISIGDSFKIAIGVQDSIVPSMAEGEKKLYSRDSVGAITAFVNFLASGVLELNGNTDFAVRFNALQTKLTALEAQLIAHVHPGVLTGGASTGPSVTPFDIDISAAKVDEVKVK